MNRKIEDFLTQMQNNNEFNNIIKKNDVDEIVEFSKKHGYSFTREEFSDFLQKNFGALKNSRKDSMLTEEELESVVGGISNNLMVTLMNLGQDFIKFIKTL